MIKYLHVKHVFIVTGGNAGADCKLRLTTVRHNLLSMSKMLDNWTDGRISCRHCDEFLHFFRKCKNPPRNTGVMVQNKVASFFMAHGVVAEVLSYNKAGARQSNFSKIPVMDENISALLFQQRD